MEDYYYMLSHQLNLLRMDSLIIFASSMHGLLGVIILPFHGIYNDMAPYLPTSMHFQRIRMSLNIEEIGFKTSITMTSLCLISARE